jgi:hypothetical protein
MHWSLGVAEFSSSNLGSAGAECGSYRRSNLAV